MNRDILFDLYTTQQLPLKIIAEKLETTKELVSYYVKKYNFPRRNAAPIKRSVNEQVGDWTLLRYLMRNKRGCWECRCSCGEVAVVEVSALNSGNSNSCKPCAMAKMRDYNVVPAHYWLKLTTHAAKRNHEVNITREYTEELLKKQNYRCALTGWPIGFGRGRKVNGKHSEGETTASLDRKNSCGNYTENNVQWVHKDVNRMKQSFTEERLFVLCEAVIKHAKEGTHVGSSEIPA